MKCNYHFPTSVAHQHPVNSSYIQSFKAEESVAYTIFCPTEAENHKDTHIKGTEEKEGHKPMHLQLFDFGQRC